MEANLRYEGGVAILDLSGRLVAGAEADSLRVVLFRVLETGHPRILLNCEKVSHVDSGGLGDLVSWYTTIRRQGGIVRVLHPHRRLRELLEVTRLNRMLEVFEDEATAMADFSNGADSQVTQRLAGFQE